MKKSLLVPIAFLLLIGLLLWHPWRPSIPLTGPPVISEIVLESPPAPTTAAPEYTHADPSPGGTGKTYLGREIAHVMGHQGIGWLERESREREEAPSRAVEALDLSSDAIVADIGAGSGYYSFRMASMVPDGEVVAVDIQPEMVAHLQARAESAGVTNIRPHLGTIEDSGLEPESIDAALMVDAYHEFSHPFEMMTSIVEALKPGGRVILLEYRAEDPDVPIKKLHKMSEAQVRKEMEVVGLKFSINHDFLPWQHFLVFEKPAK